jgi:hypothetical protein
MATEGGFLVVGGHARHAFGRRHRVLDGARDVGLGTTRKVSK